MSGWPLVFVSLGAAAWIGGVTWLAVWALWSADKEVERARKQARKS